MVLAASLLSDITAKDAFFYYSDWQDARALARAIAEVIVIA
jgi:hypothetical protein